MYVEVRGGYTYNQLDQKFTSATFKEVEATGSSYIAVMATYHIVERVLVKFGSEWVSKKYLLRRAQPFRDIYKKKDNNYLQVPASIGLLLISTKKLRFVAGSGVFGGYWLSSTTKGTIPNAFNTFNTIVDGDIIQNFWISEYSTRSTLNEDDNVRIEAGILFEATANYSISPIWSLATNFSYQHALTSQRKRSPDIINRTLIASVGVMYKLR
ncbi:hypothetical protein [Tunicatimonas pelagia]|uniref:hypothetical protein n=1 Tax=Tunicatimonas pelagia TaxID=931531 RepID=UPI0026671F40|nr:hypothetical protein [Tunicatimonas pelagia]WKN45085.1 hypothetical protein P0M28_08930 [Tunicatimonas pelagia]